LERERRPIKNAANKLAGHRKNRRENERFLAGMVMAV
jgi:hypothetical protein